MVLRSMALTGVQTRGLGFLLSHEYPCVLINIFPGGAADSAGIKEGDHLRCIGRVDVTKMSQAEVAKIFADQQSLRDRIMITVETSDRLLDADLNGDTENSVDSDSQVWRETRQRVESQLQTNSLQRQRERASLCPVAAPSRRRALNLNSHQHRLPSYGTLSRREMKRSTAKSACLQSASNKENRPSISMWQLNGDEPILQARGSRGRQKAAGASSDGRRRSRANRSSSVPPSETPNSKSNSVSMIAHAASDDSDEPSVPCRSMINARYSDTSTSTDGKRAPPPPKQRAEAAAAAAAAGGGGDALLLLQCVVVYIGAIAVAPGQSSRSHIVRSAIGSLKAQRAKARTVRMQLFPDQVVVTNSRGQRTHRLAAESVTFCAACKENKQFFGVCTAAPGGPAATVCHVFAADPQLNLHTFHYQYAKTFDIVCSRDPQSNYCLEFPHISTPIVHAFFCMQEAARLNRQRLQLTQNNAGPPRSSVSRPNGYYSSDSGIGAATSEPSQRDSALSDRNSQVLRSLRDHRRQSPLKVTFEEPKLDLVQADVHEQPNTESEDQASAPRGQASALRRRVFGSGRTHHKHQSEDLIAAVATPPTSRRHLAQPPPATALSELSCDSDLASATRSVQDLLGDTTTAARERALMPHLSKSADPMAGTEATPEIEAALADARSRKPFQDFLNQQFCGENLTFWLAVEEYRSASNSSKRRLLGVDLFERYFADGCSEPVNVDSRAQNAIETAFRADQWQPQLFDSAQYQIFHLLKYDCWPRYLQWTKMGDKRPSKTTLNVGELNASAASLQSADKRREKRKSLLNFKSRFSRKKKDAPVSLLVPEANVESEPVSDSSGRLVSTTGSRRKQQWTSAGKQYSMPTELAHDCQPSTSSRPDVVPANEPSAGDTVTATLPSGDLLELRLPTDEKECGVGGVSAMVVPKGSDSELDPALSARRTLAGRQIHFVERVVFEIELPAADGGHRRPVVVKAPAHLTSVAALGAVFARYNLSFVGHVVCFQHGSQVLRPADKIDLAANKRLRALTDCEFTQWFHGHVETEQASAPENGVDLQLPSPKHFEPLPSTPGLSICQLDQDSPSLAPVASTHALPNTPKMTGAGGMLKYVRRKSGQRTDAVPDPMPPPPPPPPPSVPEKQSASRRKSLGILPAVVSRFSRNGPAPVATVSDPSSERRQTCANADELRKMRESLSRAQDDKALGQLLTKAQHSRMDDQRCALSDASTRAFELPDFLKSVESAATPRKRRSVDSSWDDAAAGLLPSDAAATALFGARSAALHCPWGAASPPAANVSVVRVEPPSLRVRPAFPLCASSVDTATTTITVARGGTMAADLKSSDSSGWRADYV